MSAQSKIEWTDATWNPIVGCSVISPGCTNCYAMKLAPRTDRLSLGAKLAGPLGQLTKNTNAGPVWTGALRFIERRLSEPMHWRKPRRIFVNSMGDLFHESVPDEWIDRVFAIMALCPQHTFQVLTKRAQRMRAYFSRNDQPFRVAFLAGEIQRPWGYGSVSESEWRKLVVLDQLPLPNVSLGVSAERQEESDERIPLLLQTPAAIRFVSAEPLIAELDLSDYLVETARTNWDNYLDWVIVGGESGTKARRAEWHWIKSIIDQCAESRVPCFVKQMGSWQGFEDRKGGNPSEWPEQLRVRQFPETLAKSEAA